MLKGLFPITLAREPDSCRNQDVTAMSMLSVSSAPRAARNACAPMISYAVATAISGAHVGRDDGFPHHEGIARVPASVVAGPTTQVILGPEPKGPEVVSLAVWGNRKDRVGATD